MAEPMTDAPDVCGKVAPWGAVCPSAPGHPLEHDWRSRMMTAREVGDRLGTSFRQVKTIPPAELPYFRVGSRGDRRYNPADVERYIAARRVG